MNLHPDRSIRPARRRIFRFGITATFCSLAVAGAAVRVAVHAHPRPRRSLSTTIARPAPSPRHADLRPRLDSANGIRIATPIRVVVKAFAVEAGSCSFPGPSSACGRARRSGRSFAIGLDGEALAVHGLYSRPAKVAGDAVVIPAGESREIKFMAGWPGTYYYWGATAADTPLRNASGVIRSCRRARSSIRAAVRLPDRVLVIGMLE